MKSNTKKMLIYILLSLAGFLCAWLQNAILRSGYDEQGLLVTNNPMVILLWGTTVCVMLGLIPMLSTLGTRGTYEQNFPRCVLSGSMMILSGLLMAFSGINSLVPGQGLRAGLAIGTGGMMALCGIFRMMGKKPPFGPDLLIGLYYAAHLLWSYSGWNANPQLQRYAFQLLAGAVVMLFSIHRARCIVGIMDRKRLVYLGLLGIFLSIVAIPGGENLNFFLASGLWCAGAMADLGRIRKYPRRSSSGA